MQTLKPYLTEVAANFPAIVAKLTDEVAAAYNEPNFWGRRGDSYTFRYGVTIPNDLDWPATIVLVFENLEKRPKFKDAEWKWLNIENRGIIFASLRPTEDWLLKLIKEREELAGLFHRVKTSEVARAAALNQAALEPISRHIFYMFILDSLSPSNWKFNGKCHVYSRRLYANFKVEIDAAEQLDAYLKTPDTYIEWEIAGLCDYLHLTIWKV